MCFSDTFLPVYDLSLNFLHSVFQRASILILMKCNISIFFSYGLCSLCPKKSFISCNVTKIFSYVIVKNFMVLGFIFMSILWVKFLLVWAIGSVSLPFFFLIYGYQTHICSSIISWLNCLSLFVKNQLTIYVWICFWFLLYFFKSMSWLL